MLVTWEDRRVTVEFQATDTAADFSYALAQVVFWLSRDDVDVRVTKQVVRVTVR